jgi:tRNA threonylcarbamoyladenosine biosynthesis protein TsaE
MYFLSKSALDTRKFAAQIADNILHSDYGKKAVVLTLRGQLGAGKTTFIQGFLKQLGLTRPVKSPTFVLMREYDLKIPKPTKSSKSKLHIAHLDCYRLRNWHDLNELDFKEMLARPGNIILIEWPEIISKILPKKTIQIHIDHIDEHSRKITVAGLILE